MNSTIQTNVSPDKKWIFLKFLGLIFVFYITVTALFYLFLIIYNLHILPLDVSALILIFPVAVLISLFWIAHKAFKGHRTQQRLGYALVIGFLVFNYVAFSALVVWSNRPSPLDEERERQRIALTKGSENIVHFTYLGSNVDSEVLNSTENTYKATVKVIFEAESKNGGDFFIETERQNLTEQRDFGGEITDSQDSTPRTQYGRARIPIHLEPGIPQRFAAATYWVTYTDQNGSLPNISKYSISTSIRKSVKLPDSENGVLSTSELPIVVVASEKNRPDIKTKNERDTNNENTKMSFEGIPIRYDVTMTEVEE